MHGRVCDWNTAAETMLGWSQHEARGRLVFDLITPERFRAQSHAALQRFRDTGKLDPGPAASSAPWCAATAAKSRSR
jgi:PAS domain S-box-containing protein